MERKRISVAVDENGERVAPEEVLADVYASGLALHKSIDTPGAGHWTITHVRSGLAAVHVAGLKKRAVDFLRQAEPLTDWTATKAAVLRAPGIGPTMAALRSEARYLDSGAAL